MAVCPEVDPASPLQFVINAAAGSSDADAKREVIETALRAGGRRGELLFCSPAELARVAHKAAARAMASGTAVVAVGGDGTINAVAQAAHAAGLRHGRGAAGHLQLLRRTHGIPTDTADAAQAAAARACRGRCRWPGQRARVPGQCQPGPVPGAAARTARPTSARFGRSRRVAFGAGAGHAAARATAAAAAHRARRPARATCARRRCSSATTGCSSSSSGLPEARRARRRRTGRGDAAAGRHAGDAGAAAARRDGPAGRGRQRRALRVPAPDGQARRACGRRGGQGGDRRRGDLAARAAGVPRLAEPL